MSKKTGLQRAQKIIDRRDASLRKWKEEGYPVLGYLCIFAPPEIMHAAGILPYRITGNPGDEVVETSQHLDSYGCPYARNCFEQGLNGNLRIVDGVVISHSCDIIQKIYGPWMNRLKPSYGHLFNAPHMVTPWSSNFYHRELILFKKSLEKFTGKEITEEKLLETIEISNLNRRLIKTLYRARSERPVLTGAEMLQIQLAGMSMPQLEFKALLLEVLEEVADSLAVSDNSPRIMIWGSPADHPKLYQVIEESGGRIVFDDICIGTRYWFNEVDISQGAMPGLTKTYFEQNRCPRTDRGPGVGRFQYILDFVREYDVQGVIAYSYSFCDTHMLDYPDLRDYLKDNGVPMLYIVDDYTSGNAESIKNRVQPFVEMLR